MEPFLQYMAGGPCYECGGKTKYAGGGQNPNPSAQARQGVQPGADEQAKKLMGFLTEQIGKGTSPSVLKRTLMQSGIKSEQASELVDMAAKSFEQQFQKGLEANVDPRQQSRTQEGYMPEDPFGTQEEMQQMEYGGLRKFLVGGFNNEPGTAVNMNNYNKPYTVKETDPAYLKQLEDPSNITVTDRNKVSNIKDTKFNRGLANMSNLSNPASAIANAPDAFGGAGLKFLAGAAGFFGSAGLGFKKFTADDRTREYDKSGNILSDSMNPDKYKKTIDKTYTPSIPATTALTQGTGYSNNTAPKVPTVTSNDPTMGVNTGYAKSKEEPMAPTPLIKMPTEEEIKQKEAQQKQNLEYNNALMQSQDRIDAGLGFEDGGEWNPFVDNRRKLKFSMPLYNVGGKVMTYEEWLGVNNLGQGMTAGDDFTEDYNKYVEAQKKQGASTIEKKGDNLGKVVANNALNGLQMMSNSTDYFANQKKEDAARNKMIMSGNTMEAAPVINPENPYGSMFTLNAGPGANQNVAQLGYKVDSGTTMASSKYGGIMQYKKGGVYQVSPEELQKIIDMGGEVEFLD